MKAVMTMIESVAVRQRGGFDFETHYDNLCALQSSCPLPAVKAHLADGILDLNGDRIRSVNKNIANYYFLCSQNQPYFEILALTCSIYLNTFNMNYNNCTSIYENVF